MSEPITLEQVREELVAMADSTATVPLADALRLLARISPPPPVAEVVKRLEHVEAMIEDAVVEATGDHRTALEDLYLHLQDALSPVRQLADCPKCAALAAEVAEKDKEIGRLRVEVADIAATNRNSVAAKIAIRADNERLREALRRLMARLDDHFGGPDRSGDWREQEDARRLLSAPAPQEGGA